MVTTPSRLGRVHAWVERECQIAPSQIALLRSMMGIFGIYAFGVLIQQGYPSSSNGAYFNLPLIDALALVPPAWHRLAVLSVGPLSALLLIGVLPATSSLLLSGVFAYVIASDHMGFRHIWVLLSNLFLLTCALQLASRWPRTPGAGRGESTLAPYALFAARGFVAIIYLIAGAAKLNPSFLSGEVIEDLNAQWEIGSLAREALRASPHFLPLAATASAATELCLGVGLAVRRLRRIALAVGFAFHLLVPILGKVAPDLNFIFVATYLFFVWNPLDRRLVVRAARSGLLSRWGPRLDILQRVVWRAEDLRVSRVVLRSGRELDVHDWRGFSALALEVVGLNPFFVVYVPFWIYFLLPIEPWAWANQPLVAALTIGCIPGAAWLLGRHGRDEPTASGTPG